MGVLGLAELAPGVPEELGPQAIAPLAAAVAALVAAAAKAVGELDAKGRREAKKALKAAVKKMKAAKAAGGGEGGGSVDLDEALRVLQAEGAVVAAAAVEARAPFAWADGPLVTAMRRGDMILVDEINLAEDAVLERLNRYVWGWGGRPAHWGAEGDGEGGYGRLWLRRDKLFHI